MVWCVLQMKRQKRRNRQAITMMFDLMRLAKIDFKCLGNGIHVRKKDFFFNLLNMLQ